MNTSRGAGNSRSAANPLHFLQIWIHPRERGLSPAYTEWKPGPGSENDTKVLVISADGRDGSALIQQDAEVWRLRLAPGESAGHQLAEGRGLWLQLINGSLETGGARLEPGDTLSTETAGKLKFLADDQAVEALLFELA